MISLSPTNYENRPNPLTQLRHSLSMGEGGVDMTCYPHLHPPRKGEDNVLHYFLCNPDNRMFKYLWSLKFGYY